MKYLINQELTDTDGRVEKSQKVRLRLDTAEVLADKSEGPTNYLLSMPMFPIDHAGISEVGNMPWNTIALPNDPQYKYSLAASKRTAQADTYFEYPRGE